MFDELAALLDDSYSSHHPSIFISSFDIDSNFLLQHFLSFALKNSLPCVYLSFLTPFSHLKHIQGKMGHSLKSPEISSTSPLMFFPVFSTLSERFFQGKSSMTIDEFLTMIEKQLVASPQMIIIEDLQILRHLFKWNDNEILLFYRKLQRLYPQTQLISQMSISDEENEENYTSPLINMLKRLHDKHLFVRNLPTGPTKDITGQLIYTGPSQSNLWTNRPIRNCLFRLTERTLNLISSAV